MCSKPNMLTDYKREKTPTLGIKLRYNFASELKGDFQRNLTKKLETKINSHELQSNAYRCIRKIYHRLS